MIVRRDGQFTLPGFDGGSVSLDTARVGAAVYAELVRVMEGEVAVNWTALAECALRAVGPMYGFDGAAAWRIAYESWLDERRIDGS